MLSAADFPALPTTSADAQPRPGQFSQLHTLAPTTKDEASRSKLERKAAKKAASAERAAERERIAKEKAAERERIAKEKADAKEKAAKEKVEEKERLAKQKAEEKDRLAKEEADRKKAAEALKAEKERLAQQKKADVEQAIKQSSISSKNKSQGKGKAQTDTPTQKPRTSTGKVAEVASGSPSPILSKMPKKNKPVTRPIRIPKEEDMTQDHSTLPSAATGNSETPQLPNGKLPNVSEVLESAEAEAADTRSQSTHGPYDGGIPSKPKPTKQLLREIEAEKGRFYVESHPLFDISKVSPNPKLPLDYATMARALSAFPAAGGALASGTLNDETVASFQQLLETLTQTMSELVQLLPQTAWGTIFDILSQDLKDLKREYALANSTSFDGLVHDDLPEDVDDEDDFEISPPQTPTMDKRAKWMEIQLAKLEELHREVNSAAIRTILATNDQGRDRKGILPAVNHTLARFEGLGIVDENGTLRRMSMEELEKKLVVAREAAVFAETELREAMEAMLTHKP